MRTFSGRVKGSPLANGVDATDNEGFRRWIGDMARAPALPWFRPASILTAMRWEDLITVTPGVRSGKPCVAGTRITVQDVLGYLASGMSEAQVLADFPSLTPDSIRAVLSFAATRERRRATPVA